jgi:hypothetical protein
MKPLFALHIRLASLGVIPWSVFSEHALTGLFAPSSKVNSDWRASSSSRRRQGSCRRRRDGRRSRSALVSRLERHGWRVPRPGVHRHHAAAAEGGRHGVLRSRAAARFLRLGPAQPWRRQSWRGRCWSMRSERSAPAAWTQPSSCSTCCCVSKGPDWQLTDGDIERWAGGCFSRERGLTLTPWPALH